MEKIRNSVSVPQIKIKRTIILSIKDISRRYRFLSISFSSSLHAVNLFGRMSDTRKKNKNTKLCV